MVVGDVGPLGGFIEPLGKLTFNEAYGAYKEQIKALEEADLLIIETISDIPNAILKGETEVAKQKIHETLEKFGEIADDAIDKIGKEKVIHRAADHEEV